MLNPGFVISRYPERLKFLQTFYFILPRKLLHYGKIKFSRNIYISPTLDRFKLFLFALPCGIYLDTAITILFSFLYAEGTKMEARGIAPPSFLTISDSDTAKINDGIAQTRVFWPAFHLRLQP
jgi:hypothetical protein